MDPEIQYCYDRALEQALDNNFTELAKYLIANGANNKIVKTPKIRSELGLPKWNKKPNNMEFRTNSECSISGEKLNKNIKQLGCSSCRNVFKLDALEYWLNIHYRCPYCNSSNEFYLIYD